MSRRGPESRRRGQRIHLPGYWAPVVAGVAVGIAVGFSFASLALGVAAGLTVGFVLAWEQRHSARRD